MARFQSHITKLRRENKSLVARVDVLEKSSGEKNLVLRNNMSSLVDQFMQSNLTSWNPIIANNIYAPITIDWLTLTYMYKTHGIIQAGVEMPVLDAIRGGLEFKSSQLDADDIKLILDYIEENDVFAKIVETATWGRLYGGGALVVNILDQDPESPLVLKQSDADIQLYAANRWEFGMGFRADNPVDLALMPGVNFDFRYSPSYSFYGKKVDKSRVLDFAGKAPPALLRWQLQGWGMSEIERVVEDFNAYIKHNNVVYDLLENAKLDIFKIQDLASQLLTPTGTSIIYNRLQRMNQLKNFHNALILDKVDDYEQKQITFSGLAEMKKEIRIGMASAWRMPMTKLFGLSASGFNSGEDDIENYNGIVESEVRQKLRPLIRKIVKIIVVHLFGTEMDIHFDFKPLRVLSAVEEETVKTSKQNRHLAIYDRGLYTPQELMEELGKEQLVPTDTAAGQGLMKDRPEGSGFLPGDKGGKDDEGDDKGGKKKEKKGEGDNER